MAAVYTLLSKFGLFAPKAEEPAAFDLRLTRLQNRESRQEARGTIFIRSRV